MGQSCTLRLDARAERCAWEGPAGTHDIGLPDLAWSVVPEGLVAEDADGGRWELGVAVSAPIGWLCRDGVPVGGVGAVEQVADERARRSRAASADRLADATLAAGDTELAELLEWAKLGLPGASPIVRDASAPAAWHAWWAAQSCRAAVPRAAHAALLGALFGLHATGEGTARLAPRLPTGWPAWRLERWRLGRSVLDVALARRDAMLRCTLLPRHGPPPVLTVGPDRLDGLTMLVEGEPIMTGEIRLELRERLTVEWDAD